MLLSVEGKLRESQVRIGRGAVLLYRPCFFDRGRMETVSAARPSAVYYWGVHVQGSMLDSHVDHFQASGLDSSRGLAPPSHFLRPVTYGELSTSCLLPKRIMQRHSWPLCRAACQEVRERLRKWRYISGECLHKVSICACPLAGRAGSC